MNKLMKFCGKCEEAFADRFAFCPNCGGELETYEMNPVTNQPASAVQESPAEPVSTPVILAEAAGGSADVLEIPEFENIPSNAVSSSNGHAPEEQTLESVNLNEPAVEAEPPVYTVSEPMHEVPSTPAAPAVGGGWREVKSKSLVPADDGLYHITIVPNRTIFNDSRFRAAGIAALVVVLSLSFGSIVYSLFNQYVNVNSPDASDLVGAVYINDDPIDIEKVPVPKDKNQAGGGGGGGGRNDPEPPSEGRLATQLKTPPMITPSKEDISANTELKMYRTVQGPNEIIRPNDGRPMGYGMGKIPSDGMGDGTGQGGGSGGGQGPGRGNGGGAGNDGGCCGPGTGGGSGGPGGGDPGDPPAMPKGPTVNVVIVSKPRPSYTEEARKNQISGTVRLRVTFNSNGTIGSVSQVSGLGYGLTEQAISAAKNIRFEPAKRGGVPYTVAKVVEFNFNLY